MTQASASVVTIERLMDAPEGFSDYKVTACTSFTHEFMVRLMDEYDSVLELKLLDLVKTETYEDDREVLLVMRYRFKCNVGIRAMQDLATLVKLSQL